MLEHLIDTYHSSMEKSVNLALSDFDEGENDAEGTLATIREELEWFTENHQTTIERETKAREAGRIEGTWGALQVHANLIAELSRAAYDADGNQYSIDEVGDAAIEILKRHGISRAIPERKPETPLSEGATHIVAPLPANA